MSTLRLSFEDGAMEDLDREIEGVETLLDREQITEPEAAEWVRQAAQEAAQKVRIETA